MECSAKRGMERRKKRERGKASEELNEITKKRGARVSHTNFNDHSFNEKDFFTGVIYDLKVARS